MRNEDRPSIKTQVVEENSVRVRAYHLHTTLIKGTVKMSPLELNVISDGFGNAKFICFTQGGLA